MRKIYTLLLLSLALSNAFAQDGSSKPVKYRKTMPIFLELAGGFNSSKFIDFGTSPLYYRGLLKTVSLSYRKTTEKREVAYTGNYSFGNYAMNYNDILSASKSMVHLSLRHSRLYQVDAFDNKLWNLKVGGTLDANGLMRINDALMNNQFGFDVFVNLMASAKVSKDISNAVPKKLWFIKIKPKQRNLAYQLDLGLINSAYRNDYIYSNSTGVYNENKLLGGHSFKMFSGFRMSSRLDYEHAIFGNNTLKYSYVWDAMMSGNDNQDRMQLANNFFLISLNIKFR